MADPVVTNIFKSGAICWMAPAGEALPSGDTIGLGAAWGGNWARVGFTKAPVAVKYEAEEYDIEVEEFLAPVDRAKIGEKIMVETVLAELTSDYLKLGTGGTVTTVAASSTVTGKDTLAAGNDARLTKYVFGFEGSWINANGVELPVRFFIHRATFKLNGDLTFSKRNGEYTGIPLQISGLANSADSGRLFKLERIVAPKTA